MSLPQAAVKRIKFSRQKTHLQRIKLSAQAAAFIPEILCIDAKLKCRVLTFVLLAPITFPIRAFAVAAAPIHFGLEGLASLKPPTTYDVVP